jgi:hypothetical protein
MANISSYNWIIKRLNENHKIKSTKIDNENVLHINRVDGPSLRLVNSSLELFTYDDIKPVADQANVDFILHTFKDPYISGDVFEYLDIKRKVLGGYGDLFRVLNQGSNYPYLPPEVKFIKRGLEQHNKVSNVRRLDERRYEITRHGLEAVIIVALNDYDLGTESIRNAVDKYRAFDAVLKSNPNGRITTSALELSNSIEIKVFQWRELLAQLNHRWNWKK